MSADQRKRARKLVHTACEGNYSKRNKLSNIDIQPSRHNETKVFDPPVITIPSMTDEELNMAIQSISNDNNFEITDTLVVDCSLDGLVDEQEIYYEESVPISNNVEVEQLEDYADSRSKSPDSETSVHIEVIKAVVHCSSPKKLLSNNTVKSSSKIPEAVCKENIVPTNFLPAICEKNTPSTKENYINLDKGVPEKEKMKVVSSDSSSKNLENIDLKSKNEQNIPSIEENNKTVDKSVSEQEPIILISTGSTSNNLQNKDLKLTEEEKYIESTKEIKINAGKSVQEQIKIITVKDSAIKSLQNIHTKPIEEENNITTDASVQEQEIIIENIDITSKNLDNIEVRLIEEDINISRIQEIDLTVDKNTLEEEIVVATIDSTSNTFEDVDFIPVEEDLETTFDNTEKRPNRGRKRISAEQNRAIRKKRTNTNEDYVSAKGKEVKSKTFSGNDFHCRCPKKCTEKLSADSRKAEFDKFWKAGSYEARCALLQGYVKETNKKRSYSLNSRRTYTRKYYIQDLEVCKKTLLNTLSISQARIDNALIKNRNNEAINDKRGVNSGGKNKISSTQLNEMRDFIGALPRYVSHYCRNSSTSNYLAPNLNLPILYNKYKEKTNNPVSFSRFRQCFMKDFNLKFKKPQKDTCLRCDTYKANTSGANNEQKALYNTQHQEHLDHAYSLREQMKSDLALAKSDALTETLTFDLEKTHSLPRLPTSVVYYKRQLNLYNLGIHCGSTGKGYFYVWLEHEAGRGTQEVGSCIRKFIQENLKPGVTHLILWSDSCGGQNRSIKMVLVLLHILQNHPTLEKITLRFLQPGHTFLPNDSEFGDVECALKTQPRLYTADDFIEVMQNCRRKNKFQVTKITKNDFFSIETILNQITNRKSDTQKNKISWLDTFEIQIKKKEPTMLYMKSKLTNEAKIVDIGKGGKGRKKQIDFENPLPLLHPEGRELSAEKIKDLKDILKLIPSDAKPFYNFLKNVRTGAFTDDVDGFGSSIDFEIEEF